MRDRAVNLPGPTQTLGKATERREVDRRPDSCVDAIEQAQLMSFRHVEPGLDVGIGTQVLQRHVDDH
jgi:hypothetical protein